MNDEPTVLAAASADDPVVTPSIPIDENAPEGEAPPASGVAPPSETAPESGVAPPNETAPESGVAPDQRDQRRQKLILLLLLVAVGALITIGGWYLLFRKPISELPLPGITLDTVPHYGYSIYDVVAPTGVAVNADGSRIYAVQTEGDPQVVAFDGAGKQVASLKPPASATGNHVPVYVAVDPVNGDVYVSDRPAATVYVYSADGAYLRAFDPGPGLQGWAPLGLAFDAKGDLFVTSVGAPFQAVHEFAPDGTFIRTYGKANEFSFPNGVAVDAAGNVYVTDSNNGRLVVFDRDGNQVGLIGHGSGVGNLGLPRGMAIDDSGRVYVADVSQQGVQVYRVLATGETQPRYIGRFGEEGSGDGAFELPNAVAVDGRSRVYVADWRNNRIQVWTY